MLRRTLPENIRMDLRYDKDEYMVNADPTRVQQAVLNLVVNACDAMPEGGKLHIALDRMRVNSRLQTRNSRSQMMIGGSTHPRDDRMAAQAPQTGEAGGGNGPGTGDDVVEHPGAHYRHHPHEIEKIPLHHPLLRGDIWT